MSGSLRSWRKTTTTISWLLDNGTVDLSELARETFILNMPSKTLCREDCRGLCSGCGVNLNYEKCRCKKEVDPRLAALAKILEQ